MYLEASEPGLKAEAVILYTRENAAEMPERDVTTNQDCEVQSLNKCRRNTTQPGDKHKEEKEVYQRNVLNLKNE